MLLSLTGDMEHHEIFPVPSSYLVLQSRWTGKVTNVVFLKHSSAQWCSQKKKKIVVSWCPTLTPHHFWIIYQKATKHLKHQLGNYGSSINPDFTQHDWEKWNKSADFLDVIRIIVTTEINENKRFGSAKTRRPSVRTKYRLWSTTSAIEAHF